MDRPMAQIPNLQPYPLSEDKDRREEACVVIK